MKVLLRFYNGDAQEQEVRGASSPPGRLYWADTAPPGDVTREFWLDLEVWAREQRAEYREVAKGDA